MIDAAHQPIRSKLVRIRRRNVIIPQVGSKSWETQLQTRVPGGEPEVLSGDACVILHGTTRFSGSPAVPVRGVPEEAVKSSETKLASTPAPSVSPADTRAGIFVFQNFHKRGILFANAKRFGGCGVGQYRCLINRINPCISLHLGTNKTTTTSDATGLRVWTSSSQCLKKDNEGGVSVTLLREGEASVRHTAAASPKAPMKSSGVRNAQYTGDLGL